MVPGSGALPRRIHAINKHPYSGSHSFPFDQEHGQAIDALGQKIGGPNGDHTEGDILNLTYAKPPRMIDIPASFSAPLASI